VIPQWILEEKWNIPRDCKADKGVHLFGLCRLRGKESLLVGTASRNINFEDHCTMFWVRIPMYTCLILGQSAYVYNSWLDSLCGLRPKSLDL
jgi:hypothetical protein